MTAIIEPQDLRRGDRFYLTRRLYGQTTGYVTGPWTARGKPIYTCDRNMTVIIPVEECGDGGMRTVAYESLYTLTRAGLAEPEKTR